MSLTGGRSECGSRSASIDHAVDLFRASANEKVVTFVSILEEKVDEAKAAPENVLHIYGKTTLGVGLSMATRDLLVCSVHFILAYHSFGQRALF